MGAQAMDAIVEVLVEKETISGDEFRKILGQYTKIPEENYSKWDRETVRHAMSSSSGFASGCA
jgi:hypothetical protein